MSTSRKNTNKNNSSNTNIIGRSGDDDDDDKIEISVADFARYNRAIIKLLRVLDKEEEESAEAGGEGLPTRMLIERLNRTHNAQAAIKRAEREGYIKRIRDVKKPEGSGNRLVINVLTPKGQQLLDKLAAY